MRVEIDVGEAGAGELAGFDPAGEMVDGGEGDGFVGGGKWGVEFGADELVFCGAGVSAGEGAVPTGPGCGGVGDGDFAGADAALVERGHRLTPVAGGLGAVFFGERGLDEFFGFGEGGRVLLRGRRRARCRRRAARREWLGWRGSGRGWWLMLRLRAW